MSNPIFGNYLIKEYNQKRIKVETVPGYTYIGEKYSIGEEDHFHGNGKVLNKHGSLIIEGKFHFGVPYGKAKVRFHGNMIEVEFKGGVAIPAQEIYKGYVLFLDHESQVYLNAVTDHDEVVKEVNIVGLGTSERIWDPLESSPFAGLRRDTFEDLGRTLPFPKPKNGLVQITLQPVMFPVSAKISWEEEGESLSATAYPVLDWALWINNSEKGKNKDQPAVQPIPCASEEKEELVENVEDLNESKDTETSEREDSKKRKAKSPPEEEKEPENKKTKDWGQLYDKNQFKKLLEFFGPPLDENKKYLSKIERENLKQGWKDPSRRQSLLRKYFRPKDDYMKSCVLLSYIGSKADNNDQVHDELKQLEGYCRNTIIHMWSIGYIQELYPAINFTKKVIDGWSLRLFSVFKGKKKMSAWKTLCEFLDHEFDLPDEIRQFFYDYDKDYEW